MGRGTICVGLLYIYAFTYDNDEQTVPNTFRTVNMIENKFMFLHQITTGMSKSRTGYAIT